MPELAISAWRSYAVKLAKCPPPLICHDLSLFKTKSRRSVGVAIMKRKLFSKETSIGEISAKLTFLFKLSLYCTHSPGQDQRDCQPTLTIPLFINCVYESGRKVHCGILRQSLGPGSVPSVWYEGGKE